jgi:pSer/pThr/pTyr-binding forkhead associated (FHA) protein
MRELTIGRLPSNDIVLTDNSVSRSHAVLQVSGNEFFVRDLGSANGTFVNGIHIKGTTQLRRNDILKVGNSLVPWMNYINDNSNRTYVTPQPSTVVQTAPSYGNGMKQKLPNASAALTLGIIGIVFSLGLVGIILNIIAIVLGAGAISRFEAEPGRYTEGSLSQAKAGKVLGIVGLALFGFILILIIAANA